MQCKTILFSKRLQLFQAISVGKLIMPKASLLLNSYLYNRIAMHDAGTIQNCFKASQLPIFFINLSPAAL